MAELLPAKGGKPLRNGPKERALLVCVCRRWKGGRSQDNQTRRISMEKKTGSGERARGKKKMKVQAKAASKSCVNFQK